MQSILAFLPLWMSAVHGRQAVATRLEALPPRRFQRESFYTGQFQSSSAAAFVMEVLTSACFMLIDAIFDTYKFICEIEQRPAIYNKTLKE